MAWGPQRKDKQDMAALGSQTDLSAFISHEPSRAPSFRFKNPALFVANNALIVFNTIEQESITSNH